MMKKALIIICSFFLINSSNTNASVIGFGLMPSIQYPNKKDSVTGLRLSLGWGEAKKVSGIDLGVIGNITTGRFTGLALSGLFNSNQSTRAYGAQLAGLANVTKDKSKIYGVQLAGLTNASIAGGKSDVIGVQATLGVNFAGEGSGKVVGAQIAGLVNLVPQMRVYGLQLAVINTVKRMGGVQVGGFNKAEKVTGIQIGVINYAEKLKGIQIGLINIHSNSIYPVLPIINAAF